MGFLDNLFSSERDQLRATTKELREEIAGLKAEREARKRERVLHDETLRLKEQIEDLKIEKGRLTEDNQREIREVRHMVGLERKRQEFEAEQAKKDVEAAKRTATLEVREENLAAERQTFDDHMEFREKRFTEEVDYLKDLMGQILDRLPTVNVDRQIKESSRTEKKA